MERFARSSSRSEILHEHHAQGNGDRPELADRQWLHTLVSAHEAPQHFRIEPAVAVRNERPSEPVDARIPLEVPLRQLGQFSIIAGRQVVVDFAQLFVDDVIIVDQPFRRRRDGALLPNRPGNRTIRFEEHFAVVQHARQ